MSALRQILMSRHWPALWLVGLALALKMIVPGGYMFGQQGTVLTVTICGDASATNLVRQIVVPHRVAPEDVQAKHVKSAACPYSVLDMAGAGGADPFLLAQSLAFIIAAGFSAAVAPEPEASAYLRPPLRGPPLVS